MPGISAGRERLRLYIISDEKEQLTSGRLYASQFNLHKKHKSDKSYRPEAFYGRQDYDKTLAGIEATYKKRLH